MAIHTVAVWTYQQLSSLATSVSAGNLHKRGSGPGRLKLSLTVHGIFVVWLAIVQLSWAPITLRQVCSLVHSWLCTCTHDWLISWLQSCNYQREPLYPPSARPPNKPRHELMHIILEYINASRYFCKVNMSDYWHRRCVCAFICFHPHLKPTFQGRLQGKVMDGHHPSFDCSTLAKGQDIGAQERFAPDCIAKTCLSWDINVWPLTPVWPHMKQLA